MRCIGMQAMIGWLMLASWIAILWMTWRLVQDARAAVRTHRESARVRAGFTRQD
jgi:hypothetical protein